MDTPESIAAALWANRQSYAELSDDEFESERVLLGQIKHEMRAMKSFSDLAGAQAFFADLNAAAGGASKRK